MAKVRVGVIGAGSWTVGSHLPTLMERSEEVSLVAASTIGSERQAILRDLWHFPVVTTDYREVLAAGIDACIVASPAGLHFEHAAAALAAGCHVLVEKPFTVRSRDAWTLVELGRTQQREIVVSYGWNYVDMIERTREMMRSTPGLGRVESLSIYMASGMREMLTGTGAYPDAATELRPDPATWCDPDLAGGGYGAGQLSHIFALVRWLLGVQIREVLAVMEPPPSGSAVELHDAALLRLDGGGIGAVVGSSMHAGAGGGKHQLSIRAIGDRGQFHLDLERERAAFFAPDSGSQTVDVEAGQGAYQCVGPPNALIDAAQGRQGTNRSPGVLGAEVVEVVEALYASQSQRGWATVGSGQG